MTNKELVEMKIKDVLYDYYAGVATSDVSASNIRDLLRELGRLHKLKPISLPVPEPYYVTINGPSIQVQLEYDHERLEVSLDPVAGSLKD